MIRDQRYEDRAQELREKIEHEDAIMRHWKCGEELCNNYKGTCYVYPLTNSHYPIYPINAEAWSRAIKLGEAEVIRPSPTLINSLKLNGDKLSVNPHNRQKKARATSPDTDGSMEKIYGQFMKQQMQQQMMMTMMRMGEQQELQNERQQRSRHANIASVVPLKSAVTPEPTVAPRVDAATPSSPVNNSNQGDDRATLNAFFKWLIAERPEGEREAYSLAAEVAIEQFWTISDLQSMSDIRGGLYKVAIDRFHLKDGVVRHLRAHIRRFKAVYRAADTLGGLGGVRT